MSIETLHLPCYSIGEGCYKGIPHEARRFGKKAVAIGGVTAMSKAKDKLLEGLRGSEIELMDLIPYGGNSTYENADKLLKLPNVKDADLILAIGGGRAVDTVKYVADKLDKPLFSLPTVASNCAAVSSISVFYHEDGSLADYYFPKMADHTFIESSVILDSPRDLFWAGIGDTLAKEPECVYTATAAKDLSYAARIGLEVSHTCTKPVLEYGKEALSDQKAGKATRAFEECVLDIIVSTGIVSNLVTHLPEYYYNSCLAHAFYNGSTKTSGGEKHLHGEIVSFGAMIQLMKIGDKAWLDDVARFNLSVGLPVCLSDMDISEADLDIIAETALKTTEWRFKPDDGLTKEGYIELIKETDAYGRSLK